MGIRKIAIAWRYKDFIWILVVHPVISIFLVETDDELDRKDERILEPTEAIQAVAWMEMMYKDSGLTLERANEAASVIQVILYA